ncbi:MAG: putative RNA methyltransferase, partial [Atribacterota bacterium]
MIYYWKNQDGTKKIDIAKNIIEKNIAIFRCPICRQSMSIKNNSLLCLKGHCFDLSKNGYINLLNNPVHSKYDKQMFSARKIISQSGFFQKLNEKIGDITLKEINDKQINRLKILDVGSGEGSNLVAVSKYLHHHVNFEYVRIGLDISKEGIQIAASEYPGYIWCVADLADSPFKEKQFDIIINILSPANYQEFSRLLKNDGFLIKVIPGNQYLREIREAFYQQEEKQSYSNEGVIKLFEKNFHILKKDHLLYQQKIKPEGITSLIKMTPLSWSIKKEDLQAEKYS